MCNLAGLPDRQFRFFAVPAKVAGFGTWPVRAFGHVLPAD
jgi:kynurenine formamidase